MKNIVLIGYMGAGKTTIGAMVALTMGMEFIDTDKYIVNRTHESVSTIFEKYGEKKFRNMESRLCLYLGTRDNIVIATGGGIVLNDENMRYLKHNSVTVYIRQDADTLYQRAKRSGTRPLVKDHENFVRLLTFREALYEKYADVIIEARQKTIVELSRTIIAEYHTFLRA